MPAIDFSFPKTSVYLQNNSYKRLGENSNKAPN